MGRSAVEACISEAKSTDQAIVAIGDKLTYQPFLRSPDDPISRSFVTLVEANDP